jgi:hypothetical protein
MKDIFEPETRRRQQGAWRILLLDGFESHLSMEVLEFAEQYKILLYYLPSYTTYLTQPLDVGLFGPIARAYKKEVMRRHA